MSLTSDTMTKQMTQNNLRVQKLLSAKEITQLLIFATNFSFASANFQQLVLLAAKRRLERNTNLADLLCNIGDTKVEAIQFILTDKDARLFLPSIVGTEEERKFAQIIEMLRTAIMTLGGAVAKFADDAGTLKKYAIDVKTLLLVVSVMPALYSRISQDVPPACTMKVSDAVQLLLRPIGQGQHKEFKEKFIHNLNLHASRHVPTEATLKDGGFQPGTADEIKIPELMFGTMHNLAIGAHVNPDNKDIILGLLKQVAEQFRWMYESARDMAVVARAAAETAPDSAKKLMAELDAYVPAHVDLVDVTRFTVASVSAADAATGVSVSELDASALERARAPAVAPAPLRATLTFTSLNSGLAKAATTKVEDFYINGPTMVAWIMDAFFATLVEAEANAAHTGLWPLVSTRPPQGQDPFLNRA